ncbi:MAG: hypothetical protein ACKVT1_10680 [Dehalococcoidia bacterium]
MNDLRAEPLSPIDAATLWPQLRRLSTEVIATSAGENLLLTSGLAATGLTNLPRMPRTAVLGVKRGLSYRGVIVTRELAGGVGWEAVSLRLARDMDDEVVTALLAGAGVEVIRRSGRTLYLRYPEGTPHAAAIHRGGLMSYRQEQLYAVRQRHGGSEGGPFRPVSGTDRAALFRLYCRAVPEHVRRAEAPTAQDWRGVLDSYDCEREFVAEGERGLIAWAGFSARECRVMVSDEAEGIGDATLDLVEANLPRQGALVLGEDQGGLAHSVTARGYTALGVRHVCARRMAALNPLKEAVAVAEPFALPQ